MLQIQKLYNLLSLALRKIEDLVNDHDFEKMRNIGEEKKNTTVRALKERFPDMFDRDSLNVSEISEWKLESSLLVKKLENYLDISENKEELVFLVKYLDSFLEDTIFDCIPIDRDQYSFYCLNDNFSKCNICLLPRLKCNWEHQNRDASTSYSIFYYMRNFYYIKQSDLSPYQIEHVLMPKRFFENALERGELRIMASPLISEKVVEITEPYTRDDVTLISVNPMEEDMEEKIKRFSMEVLENASFEDIDLLVFPEMLGTEEIVEQMSRELDMRSGVCNSDSPCLTMCPSIWRENRNYCKILDDMGDMICEQQKHHGVEMKKPAAKEDIESDKKIYILHGYGIGRIAVVICKDFLVTKYLRILAEKLRVNLILVPSFTARNYHFKILAAKYADLDCNVIWVNTCSARWLNENSEIENPVLLSCQPGKRGVKSEGVNMEDICGHPCRCMNSDTRRQACAHIFQLKLDREVGL